MTEIPVALIGMGKMGRALASLAPERGFRVVATLDASQPNYRGVTREALAGAQVAIEFTSPEAAPDNARACAAAGCPVVVGTTGWYDRLPEVSSEVEQRGSAMLTAPNFSVGVAVFDRVVAEAARLFAQLDGLTVTVSPRANGRPSRFLARRIAAPSRCVGLPARRFSDFQLDRSTRQFGSLRTSEWPGTSISRASCVEPQNDMWKMNLLGWIWFAVGPVKLDNNVVSGGARPIGLRPSTNVASLNSVRLVRMKVARSPSMSME